MREEVVKRLKQAEAEIEAGEYEKAEEDANFCLDALIKTNFFPLLDPVLDIKQKIEIQKGSTDKSAIYQFLRLSHLIRSSDYQNILDNLLNFAEKHNGITATMMNEYSMLSPFRVSAKYHEKEIVSGESIKFTAYIQSYLPCDVELDMIEVGFSHSNGTKTSELMKGGILKSRNRIMQTIDVKPPLAVQNQKVDFISFKIGSLYIKYVNEFNSSITITPDASACQIDISMPETCIVGTKLPLTISLTAGKELLEDLNVNFLYDQEKCPIDITGEYNGMNITQSNSFGNLDSNQSLTLNLGVMTALPVKADVILAVEFKTEKSGKGVFKRSLLFNFESPFHNVLRFFDNNFEELPSNSDPVLKPGTNIVLETELTNALAIPLTIRTIKSELENLDDTSLPCEVKPGEVFAFTATINKPGVHTISIEYSAEGIESARVNVRTPQINYNHMSTTITLEAPSMAVIGKEFEAVITFKREEGIEKPQIAQYTLDVEKSPDFFSIGSTHCPVLIPHGETKSISLRFLPTTPGSVILPLITVVDRIKDKVVRRFKIPLVVAYQ